MLTIRQQDVILWVDQRYLQSAQQQYPRQVVPSASAAARTGCYSSFNPGPSATEAVVALDLF